MGVSSKPEFELTEEKALQMQEKMANRIDQRADYWERVSELEDPKKMKELLLVNRKEMDR